MKRLMLYCVGLLVSSLAGMAFGMDNDTVSVCPDSTGYNKAYMDSIWRTRYPSPEVRRRSEINSNTFRINSVVSEDYFEVTSVTLDYTKKVGQIPIKSGVSSTGGKTYEIPIEVYPGMRNFNPNLALVYNSHQGNSVLGIGWSLSGISSISRGGKTKFHDNDPQGICNTPQDALYLDGMRLIKLSEESDYILYESEQGNIKVKGYTTGNVTKYFEVYYPNGDKGVFGYTSNSTVNYVSYPIIKLSDIKGNAINYSYNYVGNHYRIIKIEYNGASVNFSYTSRLKNINNYIGGYNVIEDKLLSGIESKFGSTTLCAYSLSYTYNDYFPLLSTVNYSSNGESFNPLKFFYDEVPSGLSLDKRAVPMMEWYSFSSAKMIKVIRGKFDYVTGDDGLIVYPYSNPYLHRSEYFTNDEFQNLYEEDKPIFVYTNLSGPTVVTKGELLTGKGFIDMLCADLSGTQNENVIKVNNYVTDGKDRVIFSVYASSVMSELTSLYTRTFDFSTVYVDGEGNKSVQPKFYYTGDFNGDGKMEIMAMSVHEPFGDTSKPSICYIFDLVNNKILYQNHILDYDMEFVGDEQEDPQQAANNSDRLLVFDVNGDGKTDICHIGNDGIRAYTFTVSGSTMTPVELCHSTSLNRYNLRYKQVFVGEMNGDGLADLVVTSSCYNSGDNDWWVCNSTGTGFTARNTFVAAYNSTDTTVGFMLQDVNQDGLSDIIRYNNTNADVYPVKVNDTDSIKSASISTTATYMGAAKVIPLNTSSRNRYTQLLVLDDSIITHVSSNRHYARESLIRGMANSLGVVERNTYRNIDADGVEDGFYVVGAGEEYPYVSIQEPLAVLASVETFTNGILEESIDYTYTNAVIHRQGLGFCGFEKILSVDNNSRYRELTYDPCKYGVLIKETTAEKEITYNYSMGRRSNGTLRLCLSSKIEDNFLTGEYTPTLIDYDDYLNPKYIAVYYPGGITTNTTNLYSHNTTVGDGYFLGFLYDQTHIKYRTGTDPITDRMYVPSRSSIFPNVKLFYKGESLEENNVFMYDTYGNVVTHNVTPYSSSRTQTTTYEYDNYGRLVKETDPIGLSRECVYNTAGRLSETKDKRGNSTYYTYDAFGRETQVTYPDNTKKTVTYQWCTERTGELYSIVTAETGKTTYGIVYDALNREVRRWETRFDGTKINVSTTYNSRGKVSKESLPHKGNAPSLWNVYTYDLYDRLISVVEASGRTTTYAYDGTSVTTVEDGVETTRDYDALGNLISVTDSLGTITYNLCADSNPASVVAPGGVTTTFGYDSYRRRTSLSDPSHGTTTYEYDTSGNMSKETNARGQATQYSYDNFNRLIRIYYSDRDENYLYNDYDELVEIVPDDESYYTWFSYDNLGRISASYDMIGNCWLRRNYTYLQGNVSSIVYTTADGVLATEGRFYGYGHLLGLELDGVTTLFELLAENEFGQPTNIMTGGVTRTFSYNTYGYPVTRIAERGTTKIQYDLTSYTPATGNLSVRRDLIKGITENFYYDGMNRLTTDYYGTITYDAKGNITNKTDIGTFAYNNASKPYAVTAVTLSGNAIPPRVQNVSYTTYNRPSVISENGITARFTYNYAGERMKMEVTNGNNRLLTRYYLQNCYERDVDSQNNVVERLYLGGDYYNAPLVLIKDSSGTRVCNILRDNLGSVRYVTNLSGSTVYEELSYDAWGRLRNPTTREIYVADNVPEMSLGRGYTGHEHLPWFGLINMNARLYDPALCRFLSPDPYVQAPDLSLNFNRYVYAMNNPFRYTDENGEFWWVAVGAVIGGAVNLAVNWNNCSGFWEYFTSFGVGAVAGAVTSLSGGLGIGMWGVAGIAAASGSVVSGTNSLIAQTGKNFNGFDNVNWGTVGGAALVGGISGFAGSMAGSLASNSSFVVNGIKSPILKTAIVSPIASGASHVAGGTTMGLLEGEHFADAFVNSFQGIGQSMAIGLSTGVATTIGVSYASGINPYTGKVLDGWERHHFATNKNQKYTPKIKEITDKYGLDLDDEWNKKLMLHRGRHPNKYHDWVLDRLNYIDKIPAMNQQRFIYEFQQLVVKPVFKNPMMLRKSYYK